MAMTSQTASRTTGVTSTARFPRHVWFAHVAGFGLFVIVPLLLLGANRQEAYDLAIYDQSIWLLVNGLDFNTVAGIHVFGAHFSPILYLLQPLALIPGGAIPEIVFEAWVLALTVFPLHRLCVLLGRSSGPFLALFCLHPAVFTASWFGFHPWTLAAPFLVLATLFMASKPTWYVMALCGMVGIAFREDIGFWVVILAAMLTIARRLPPREWLLGAIAPGLASAVVVFGLMPALSPVGDYLFSSSFLGETTDVTIGTFAASSAVRLMYLLVPLGVGLASLRHLRWTVGLPLVVPLIGLGLRGGNALSTAFHYELHLALGVIVFAALAAGPILLRVTPIIVGSLIAAFAFGALRPTTPEIGPNPWGLLDPDNELREARDVLSAIDDGERSLSVPTQLLPHFSEREEAFIFPGPFDRVAREPYAMACPPPTVVVADDLAPHTPVWDSFSEMYTTEWEGSRYSIHLYAGPPIAESSCGPA